MKILMSILLWLYIISNFMCITYAFVFPDSAKLTDGRNVHIHADTIPKNEARINLQSGGNDITVEYSAASNACQKYSKEIAEIMSNKEDYEDEISNEFPWMAALGYLNGEYRIGFQCNAVVISEYFVVSAAHCLKSNRPPVVVRLGKSSLSDEYASDFFIKEIIQHPYYSVSQKRNDIGLIRLAEQIHFTKSIWPACIDTNKNDVDPTIILTEIGLGRRPNRSDKVIQSNVHTMSLSQCNQTVLDFNKDRNIRAFRDGISKSQYCVYGPNSSVESCGILSGGSLQIYPSNTSLPNIIGLISLGFGDVCTEKRPEILTRISHFVPWIESQVWPFDRRKVDKDIRGPTGTLGDISLISAARNGYEQTVSSLIQNGANVNEVNNSETALHAAAATGQEKIVRLLIHNGADFTIKNRHGKTASEIATENGFTSLTRVLRENVAQKACDTYSNLPTVTTRILGGEDASDYEFPWMAALGYLDSSSKLSFRCSATLISEKFVLTAAHCCKDDSRPVVVRLGQVNLENPEDGGIVENHQIREITNHPEYSLRLKINDISLIELVRAVYFDESIRPACLQTYLSDENPNTELTVIGWGLVSPKYRNTSNLLLKANIKTVPLSECNSTISSYAQSKNWAYFRNGLEQSHYCATDPNQMKDACEGDAGGPLQIVRRNSDISTVVGVVSTGLPCGAWTIPGIYTRVAHFIDWIESHVWPNGEIATPLINQAALYE